MIKSLTDILFSSTFEDLYNDCIKCGQDDEATRAKISKVFSNLVVLPELTPARLDRAIGPDIATSPIQYASRKAYKKAWEDAIKCINGGE